jgi:hypothetical protein
LGKLEDPFEVWDNGAISPFEPVTDNIVAWLNDFFMRTGARKRIGTQWIYQGKKYHSKNCPIPIPDYSGLVYPTQDFKEWIVLNPDGSKKFTIKVPKISLQSSPEKGELGQPRHTKGDPPYIMYGEGSDGDRNDCRFFFNMHTGQLERVDLVARHW